MDRIAQRSVNLGIIAAVISCSAAALAQDPAAPAPAAADAPAAEAPAAPPAPAEAATVADAPPPEPAAAKPKPPPYSLPFQLRPAVVGNVVRSDTNFAFFKNPANDESGSTIASMLLASYKVTDEFAPMIRLGVARNSPAKAAMGATPDKAFIFANPVVGGTYAIKPAKPLRLAFFLGLTIPVGSGGGDKPEPEVKAAVAAARSARNAMDNAMFLPNDFAIFPGVDFAYVSGGFTAQAEATIFQLVRVKGDKVPETMGATAQNPDKSKTNLTMGLHIGYFLIPQLSVGAELRHQRFVSTPKGVEADEKLPEPAGIRDTTTWAIGPRGHFKLSESVWFRPGVSFSMPIDKPMQKAEYKVVQLDLPIAF
jgi:hypothetical protein